MSATEDTPEVEDLYHQFVVSTDQLALPEDVGDNMGFDVSSLPPGQPMYYGLDSPCKLCWGPIEDPVALMPCRHVFCFQCFWEYVFRSRTELFCPFCRQKTFGIHRNLGCEDDAGKIRKWIHEIRPEEPLTFEDWHQSQMRINLDEAKYQIREGMTDEEKLTIIERRRVDSCSNPHFIYGPQRILEKTCNLGDHEITITRDIFLQIEQYQGCTRSELRRRLQVSCTAIPAAAAAVSPDPDDIEEFALAKKETGILFDGFFRGDTEMDRARQFYTTAGDFDHANAIMSIGDQEISHDLRFQRKKFIKAIRDDPQVRSFSVDWIITLDESLPPGAIDDDNLIIIALDEMPKAPESESLEEDGPENNQPVQGRLKKSDILPMGVTEIQLALAWFTRNDPLERDILSPLSGTVLRCPAPVEEDWGCRYCAESHVTGECMLPEEDSEQSTE
jgi:hypothetical protein